MLDVPQNTMSAHLAVLTRAGLAAAQRRSQSVIYRANVAAFRAVVLVSPFNPRGKHPNPETRAGTALPKWSGTRGFRRRSSVSISTNAMIATEATR